MVYKLRSHRLKLAIAHPRLCRGGSEARALWALQALKDEFDVCLITAGEVNIRKLNEYYGTSLRPEDFTVRMAPLAFVLNLFSAGDALRGAYFQRFCRTIACDFDLLMSAYNPCDFGVPAIQCIADFCWDDGVRQKYDPPPPGARRIVHNHRFLRRAYIGFVRAVAKPSSRTVFADKDCIVANSEWTAALVRDAYSVSARVLYPPVMSDFPTIHPGRRERGFVCIGRIAPEKRIEDIVEILTEVRKRGHDIHLHIIGEIGSSPYCRYIASLCQKENSWVTLEGLRFGEEKARLLSGHRFGIHARKGEAFGIAVAEMVRAGCITFVPNSGGQVEIVDHPSLVYDSIGDAADKIVTVLREERMQATLSDHLAKQAERFSTENFMNQIKAIVNEFLRQRTQVRNN